MPYESIKLVHYIGSALRIWSNLLPLRIDSWHTCTLRCGYCFARAVEESSLALMGKEYNAKLGRAEDMANFANRVNKVFSGQVRENSFVDLAVQNRWFSEVGTMGEAFQPEDLTYPATRNLLELASAYDLPIYVNTKGPLLIKDPAYYSALIAVPHKIVDVSLSGIDDNLRKHWEPASPSFSDRIELARKLAHDGVDVVISARPTIQGLTDVDTHKYVETMADAGAKSIHYRSLFICGGMNRRPYWKQYAKEHGMVREKGSNNLRYPDSYLLSVVHDAEQYAKERGLKITITASHRVFFDVQADASNKCDYTKLSDSEILSRLWPFGIIDMLKHIKSGMDKPQTLRWSEMQKFVMNNRQDILDKKLEIGQETATFVFPTSCIWHSAVKALMPLRAIIRHGVWQGWQSNDGGYIRSVRHLHILYKDEKPLLDNNGDLIYIYLPESLEKDMSIVPIGPIEYDRVSQYVQVDA